MESFDLLFTLRGVFLHGVAFLFLTGALASTLTQDKSAFKIVGTYSGHTEAVYAVAVSQDGKLFATGSLDKTVKLWDAATGKTIHTFAGPQGHQKMVLALAFSPDGLVLASAGEDNAVKLWDAAAGKLLRTLAGNQPVHSLAFSPDGAKLVTGWADGKVRIYDAAKGNVLKEINAYPKQNPQNQTMVYAVAFHPKLDQVASAGYDGTVKLWDAGTGQLQRAFRSYRLLFVNMPGHRDSVYCLAYSPDGKCLATGSAGAECLLKIWNLASGEVQDLDNPQLKRAAAFEQSHPGWIYGVSWTKNGKRLVSAGVAPGNKGYLAVWDAANGQLLHGEEMPLGVFFALALLPGEREVLLGAGARGKTTKDLNKAYVIQLPH